MRNDFFKDKAKEFWKRIEILKMDKAINKTWKQIGEETGINYNTFRSSKFYSTLPNDTILSALASYFGVTVDYLLGDDQKPTKEEKVALSETMLMRRTAVAKKIFDLRPQAFFMIERMLGDDETNKEELDIYED